jgi:predicted dehydrogenase
MANELKRDFSRRQFLQDAGWGLAAAELVLEGARPASAARTLPAPEQEQPLVSGPQLGWAVVGLGDLALGRLLPSFRACRQSRLVALVSGHADKARAVAGRYGLDPRYAYTYKDWNALGDNAAIDAVYLALPNGLHAEFAARAAQVGKHVLCERPLAATPAEGQAMLDACRQAGKQLMVAAPSRFEPGHRALLELARRPDFGPLRSVVTEHGRTLDPRQPRDRWRMSKALAGGGALTDLGLDGLQAARALAGEDPVEVSAMLHGMAGDPRFQEVEEAVHYTLRFPGGVLASGTASYGTAPVARCRACTRDGWLELAPDGSSPRLRVCQATGAEAKVEDRKIEEKNLYVLTLDHFADCIRTGRPPLTPGEEGLKDLKILKAIYEAARTGRTVKIQA